MMFPFTFTIPFSEQHLEDTPLQGLEARDGEYIAEGQERRS